MGMLISTLSALSTLHPEANPALAGQEVYKEKKIRNKQIHRLLGTVPTLSAYAYRHRIGRSYNKPQPDLGYVEVNNPFKLKFGSSDELTEYFVIKLLTFNCIK